MIDFREIYDNRPDKREVGSSGYSNLRNLYDLCMELKPSLIVESGTWKGNSSWLFSHFADVICHDIQFETLMWRSADITYIQEDISLYDYSGGDALFYFDDHISQKSRLEWLIEQGAKYAVFDDNQPYEIAKTLKNPPSPTLQELIDDNDPLMAHVERYEVLPFHSENRRQFDTRLTLIELC